MTNYNSTPFDELYVQYCTAITDAPKIYHRSLAYIIASTALANRVIIDYGGFDLYPNLYMILIGPSSISRKSWCLKIADSFIEQIRPDMVLDDYSSRESFLAAMADYDRIPVSCGILHIDEFKGFMERLRSKHHYNGMQTDLTSMYDGKSIRRKIGVKRDETETHTIDKPFLNIMTTCSFDWFTESVRQGDITGGFLARFIWVISNEPNPDPWPLPKPGDPEIKAVLINKLNRLKDVEGHIVWSQDAWEFWETWYKTFRRTHQGDMWDQNYERLSLIALKLATIKAVMRLEATDSLKNGQISLLRDDLVPAYDLCDIYVKAFQHVIVGGSEGDVMSQKIQRFLKTNKRTSRSELMRRFRISAWHMENIKQTLLQTEMLEVEIQSLQRKNKEWWLWKDAI